MQKISILFTLFAALFLSGCGGNTAKITGSVTLPDGKPLTDASITFDSGTTSVYSSLDAEGKFVLYQIKPGDSVPPGTYRGMIGYSTDDLVSPELSGEARDAALAKVLPFSPKYLSIESSGLSLTVEAGKAQNLEIVLEK